MAYRDELSLTNAIFDHIRKHVMEDIRSEVKRSIDEGYGVAAEILNSTYEDWGRAKMLSDKIMPAHIMDAFHGMNIGEDRYGIWDIDALDQSTASLEGDIKAWTYINWGSGPNLKIGEFEGEPDAQPIVEEEMADRFHARNRLSRRNARMVGREMTMDQYEGPSTSMEDGFAWVPMEGEGRRGEGWMLPRKYAIYKYDNFENPEPFKPTHFIERSINAIWSRLREGLEEISRRYKGEKI